MNKVLKSNITPLAFFEKDQVLIGISGLSLKSGDLRTNKVKTLQKIERDFKTKTIAKSGLLSRMWRLYPRASCINGNIIYFVLKGYLYSFDKEVNSLRELMKFESGMSSPLSLCSYKDGVLFGEYYNNPNKNAVKVYYVDGSGLPKVVCEIQNIRHVHNIIPGSKSDEFIVFTGDDGDEAGIALLNVESQSFKFLVRGDQKYRGCVGSVLNEKLYYATDSPFEQNSLYSLNLKDSSLLKLLDITGTAIFGRIISNHFCFSTSVESNLKKKPDGSNKIIKIDGKNGGILSKSSRIYTLNLETEKVNVIDGGKKDLLGIHYFGFGTFLFSDSDGKTVVYSSKTLKHKKHKIFFYDLN